MKVHFTRIIKFLSVAILVVYLKQKLQLDDSTATLIFHSSSIALLFCSFLGAIIADRFWGKLKTVFWLLIIYAVGSSIIAVGSVASWNLPTKDLTIFGLLLFALGSGGIKPCLAALGGEQFQLPEQAKQIQNYFTFLIFFTSFATIFAELATSLLTKMNYLSIDQCLTAALGFPAALMFLSVFIFAFGCSKYKSKIPSNHLTKVVDGNHRILIHLLILFIPLPLFWTLTELQSIRWTKQGYEMNGDLGFYKVEADKIKLTNSLLSLVFIPLVDVAIYPMLKLIGIRRPLQKMTLGGFLACIAFLCSMSLQLEIESSRKNSVIILWQLPQYAMMNMALVITKIIFL